MPTKRKFNKSSVETFSYPELAADALADRIVKATLFLNSVGYIVSKGRSSSPQLKKPKK